MNREIKGLRVRINKNLQEGFHQCRNKNRNNKNKIWKYSKEHIQTFVTLDLHPKSIFAHLHTHSCCLRKTSTSQRMEKKTLTKREKKTYIHVKKKTTESAQLVSYMINLHILKEWELHNEHFMGIENKFITLINMVLWSHDVYLIGLESHWLI